MWSIHSSRFKTDYKLVRTEIELAQWQRALAALAPDLDSIAVHNHL